MPEHRRALLLLAIVAAVTYVIVGLVTWRGETPLIHDRGGPALLALSAALLSLDSAVVAFYGVGRVGLRVGVAAFAAGAVLLVPLLFLGLILQHPPS